MRVRFYFDFISPYSYLAAELLHRRADLGDMELDPRPVALGSVFSRLGVRGPGEVSVRRRAGLQDVLLLADFYGLPLVGPPAHPFNSLYALRTVCLVEDVEQRGALVRRFFASAWGEGRSLEDLDVLRRDLRDLGIDLEPERASSDALARKRIKDFTAELLELGGYGVPTFEVDGRTFFGHDRLDLLVAYCSGRIRLSDERLAALLARSKHERPENASTPTLSAG